MPRETITPEQRAAEASALTKLFEEAKRVDPGITQESIANEMDVTQGLVNQWLTGRSPIPDKRLVWLSRRLDFDPAQVRPNLKLSIDLAASEQERKTLMVYLTNPDFRRMVDAIAESGGFYKADPQQSESTKPKKNR